MGRVYTCICASENHWTIFNGKIKCQICGREYDMSDREYGRSARLNLDASKFNEIREDLCIKGSEIENEDKG